jgi:hypothetical protein
MNAGEVKSLFQSYIDEPDGTFITNANLNTYLAAGYNEFRFRVNEYNPDFYARQVIISLNASDTYDLSSTSGNSVSIVGPAPIVSTTSGAAAAGQPIIVVASTVGFYLSQTITVNPTGFGAQTTTIANINRSTNTITLAVNLANAMTAGDSVVSPVDAMIRLNSVRISNATGTTRGAIFKAVSGIRSLQANYQSWTLIDTKLMFSESQTETFEVSYAPVPSIDWDSATAFIDTLGPFHDLIALYAYKQYAIRDNALNPAWQMQSQMREVDFRHYLSGPNYETNQYVNQDWSSFDNV